LLDLGEKSKFGEAAAPPPPKPSSHGLMSGLIAYLYMLLLKNPPPTVKVVSWRPGSKMEMATRTELVDLPVPLRRLLNIDILL